MDIQQVLSIILSIAVILMAVVSLVNTAIEFDKIRRERSEEEKASSFFNNVRRFYSGDKKSKPEKNKKLTRFARLFLVTVKKIIFNIRHEVKQFFSDVKLSFFRSLKDYGPKVRSIVKTISLVYYFILIIGLIFLFGGWTGVFLSSNASGIQVRDISYGMGIVVVSCLSYLATEAGRHNKRHDIREKNIISFKDASLSYLQKLENLKDFILGDQGGKDKFGYDASVKDELSFDNYQYFIKFKKKVSEVSSSWREVELTDLILRKRKSKNKDLKVLANKMNNLFKKSSADNSRKEIEKILKEVDVDYYGKVFFNQMYHQYESIDKDRFYTAKGMAILSVCVFLGASYIGFLIERGGIWDSYKYIWLSSVRDFLISIGFNN